ncbi:MAG: hypothetical protein ACKVP3_19020 [Hyphomicrobiaceae bacterium]
MIKLILVGLWACAITLSSCWAVVSWTAAGKPAEAEHSAEKQTNTLEHVRTKMISVPIISEGAIQGYVIAQFIFSIDAKQLKQLSIKPEAILLDEAFKVIYAGETVDFRNIKKQDLPAMLKTINDGVNKRFGSPLVESVLIQELNYVSKAEARLGDKRQGADRP